MTIVEAAGGVTGGVDTHLDVHVAAALDPLGALLGSKAFETTPAGYQSLLGWLEGFGAVTKVGVEGTGSYGAGLPDSGQPCRERHRVTPRARQQGDDDNEQC